MTEGCGKDVDGEMCGSDVDTGERTYYILCEDCRQMTEFKLSDKKRERFKGVFIYYEKDIKEFIKIDYKNLVLAKIGDISWQEYIRRKEKLTRDLK